ncbi:hypothetical protein HQ590_10385, partial [bacterium]|nr:hypothetical protein [bacterium]
MKRWLILVGVLVLAVIAGVAWWLLAARPAPPAITLLSEHTVLFMQAPHPAASRERLRATAAYALWQEPEVRAFLDVPLHFLQAFASRGQARTSAPDIEPLLDRIEGEGFIAVTYLRTFPVFQPGLMAGANVGGNQLETRLALAGLARHLKQSQPAGRVDQRRYLGIRYTLWRPRPSWVVCFGSLNSLVVFTLGEDTMRDAIARFRGRSPPSMRSLAESPRFQRFQASIPAGAD